jgi:ribonuclease P protein component
VAADQAARPVAAEPIPPTGGFGRGCRLLDSRDYDRVLKKGRRRSSPELAVVSSTVVRRPLRKSDAAAIAAGGSRLGITVGRKAGPSVKRNRFKRRVREWFRQNRGSLREPVDLVVIARRAGIDLSLAELTAQLARLIPSESRQLSERSREKQGR